MPSKIKDTKLVTNASRSSKVGLRERIPRFDPLKTFMMILLKLFLESGSSRPRRILFFFAGTVKQLLFRWSKENNIYTGYMYKTSDIG